MNFYNLLVSKKGTNIVNLCKCFINLETTDGAK